MLWSIDVIGITPMKMNLFDDVIFTWGGNMFQDEMIFHIDLCWWPRKKNEICARIIDHRSVQVCYLCDHCWRVFLDLSIETIEEIGRSSTYQGMIFLRDARVAGDDRSQTCWIPDRSVIGICHRSNDSCGTIDPCYRTTNILGMWDASTIHG